MKKYLILLAAAVLLLAGCTYESYDNNYYGSDDSGSQKEEPQESYILVILSEDTTTGYWCRANKTYRLDGKEIDDLLKGLGLYVFGHVQLSADELSGGQQQRIAIARSLIMAPELNEIFGQDGKISGGEINLGETVVFVIQAKDLPTEGLPAIMR